jgi:hypothetical protein
VEDVSDAVVRRMSAFGRQPVPAELEARHIENMRAHIATEAPARGLAARRSTWLVAAAVVLVAGAGAVLALGSSDNAGVRTIDPAPADDSGSRTPEGVGPTEIAPGEFGVPVTFAPADPIAEDSCALPPGAPSGPPPPPVGESDPTLAGRRADCPSAPATTAFTPADRAEATTGDATHDDATPTATSPPPTSVVIEPSDPCAGTPSFAGDDADGNGAARQSASDAYEQSKVECETNDEHGDGDGTQIVTAPGDGPPSVADPEGPPPEADPFPDDPCRGPPPKPAVCDDDESEPESTVGP